MRRRRLERLFVRYRERGDVAALAEVFDRTAVDLLRLAQHFAREGADAEDLLQETFVTAIERAASYDPARPLLPWLAGILANKADRVRRRADRAIDVERLAERRDVGPLEAAAARELSSELEHALAHFDADARALLAPYLRGERTPSELARERGLAPGTVRMRIHRGLERLRRLLPAGVGGSALALALMPRPLEAVRRAVLARAASAALVPTSATLASAGAATALFAMTKTSTLVCCIAGAAALAGGLFWIVERPARSVDAPIVAASTLAPGARASSASSWPASGQELELDPVEPGRDSAREEVGLARGRSARASLLIRGRVLGVEPEHFEGVRVTVVRAADEGSEDMSACEATGTTAPCSSCHAAPDRPVIRKRAVRDLSYTIAELTEGQSISSGATSDLLAEVAVDRKGCFAIELAGAFADESTALPSAFRIAADHELYFLARSELPFPAFEQRRFLAHEPVVLSAELELRPAAVVRGKLVRADETRGAESTAEKLGIALAGGELELKLVLEEGGEIYALDTGGANLEITFFHSPSATVALFPLERGAPLPTAAAQASVRFGESFELELAEEGPYLLLALDAGARPRTLRVHPRLLEIVELEPIELERGESLEGALVTATGAGASGVAARRCEEHGDRSIELPPHDLVWSHGAFEWRAVTAGIDEEGSFRIVGLAPSAYGLAPTFAAELDLAGVAEKASREELACIAPASGILLAPDLARLDVQLTRRGAPLDELPAPETDEDGPPPPPILLRVRALESGSAGELTFEGRARAAVLVEPRQRLRCELMVGEELRDARELDAPPAGSATEVLLELGDR